METYRNNYQKYHYDSYIFGNSRSLAYKVEDWSSFTNSYKTFHFDASNEALFGVERKLEYLEKTDASVKNALVLLDNDLLKQTSNPEGMLYVKHPLLSGQNWLSFQLQFLKTYFDPNFIKAYFDFKLSHKVKEYMKKGSIIDDRPVTYIAAHNELRMDFNENIINCNAQEYYGPRMNLFYKRDSVQHTSPPVIKKAQLELLLKMKRIFDSNKTNYRIVINPAYDQLKFNPYDLQQLKKIFGSTNVFDFSGKNAITDNIYNFYDQYHYRPHVAKMIIDSIYENKKRTPSNKSFLYTQQNKPNELNLR
ncbi:MAG: hypothetical protein ACTHJ5_06250 [Ilyomonas sp.]